MRQNYLISGNILAISLSSAADFPFNALKAMKVSTKASRV